jgi:hypothetical protein
MINTDFVEVKNQMWGEVRDHAWLKVWYLARNQVRNQVNDQVSGEVISLLVYQVWHQVLYQLTDMVWNKVIND